MCGRAVHCVEGGVLCGRTVLICNSVLKSPFAVCSSPHLRCV